LPVFIWTTAAQKWRIMAIISAGDKALLRSEFQHSSINLSILVPTVLLAAEVNGAHNRGTRSVDYNNGTDSAAHYTLITEGQTLWVVTANGLEKVRVKDITGDETSGTLTLDENGIVWGAGDTLYVLWNYEIWPVLPRISGGVFYKYYDLTYSDQNSEPPPVAIAGPHRAAFLVDYAMQTDVTQIATGPDDGIVSTGLTSYSNNGILLTAGKSHGFGDPAYSTWTRFITAVTQGSAVSASVLTLIPSSDYSGTVCKLRIYGEAADNPTAPVSKVDYDGRARTTAYVDWEPSAWTVGVAVQSPDIKDIINELTARSGFSGTIQIFIQNNGSDLDAYRAFVAYDGIPANSAVLTTMFTPASSVTFNVPAGDSYAVADGASISTKVVTVQPNTGITVGAEAGGLIPITYTIAGQYWVKLVVTDDNGKTQTTYRAHFVHDSSYMPYQDFTVSNLTGSWDSGGYRFTISATGDVTLDDFPDGTLVVLWYDNFYDDTEDYVNLWSLGDNIICAGYVRTDNDSDSFADGTGTVEFEVVTPEALLDAMTDFGSTSLEAKASPAKWWQYASWLTVGRAIHHELRWQSTAFTCVDIYGLTDNTDGMQAASFTEDSLLQRVNGLAYNRGIYAKMVSDRMGRLHLVRDSQILGDTLRGLLDTVMTLTNADISNVINITRNEEKQRASVDMDGFTFDGATPTPYVTMIPGYDTGISIGEFRGTGNLSVKYQVFASAADAVERVGRVHAAENRLIKEVRIKLPGNYLGAFDIVPSIGFYEWGIADTDLKRGLDLYGTRWICRQVEHEFILDRQTGAFSGQIQTTAIFEVEAFGPDGILLDGYPTSYPDVSNPPAPTWTGTSASLTVTSLGDLTGFAPPAASSVAAVRKDDTHFVMAWAGLGTDAYTPQVGLVDSSAVSMSKQTSIFPSSGTSLKYVYGIDILQAGYYFVGCEDWRAVIQELAGAFDFTDSTEGRAGRSGVPAALTSTRVVVIDRDYVGLIGISAFTCTTLDEVAHSGTLNPFHFTNPSCDIVKIDSSHALIAYVINTGDFEARVVTNSADTLVLGAVLTIESGDTWDSIQLAQDVNGNYVLGYSDQAGGYKVKLLSVSGTTVSLEDTDSDIWPGDGTAYEMNMAIYEDHGVMTAVQINGGDLTLYARQFTIGASSVTLKSCQDNELVDAIYYRNFLLAMSSLEFISIQKGDAALGDTYSSLELMQILLESTDCT
jgi:hypothetical protein